MPHIVTWSSQRFKRQNQNDRSSDNHFLGSAKQFSDFCSSIFVLVIELAVKWYGYLFTHPVTKSSQELVNYMYMHSRLNWNMLVFEESIQRKTSQSKAKKPTINSTQMWRQGQESNLWHIGGRRALSSLRHPCSPICLHAMWSDSCSLPLPSFRKKSFLLNQEEILIQQRWHSIRIITKSKCILKWYLKPWPNGNAN